jgi:predicted nucleic acid-binding protein
MNSGIAPRLLYWDSCVFLDYLESSPGRIETLDQIWEELEAIAGSKIYTTLFSTIEVSYLAQERKQHQPSADVLARLDALWWNQPLVEIVEVNHKIATLARELVRRSIPADWRLTAPDALQLATAQWLHGIRGIREIHTYDKRLHKYDSLLGVTVCEPYAARPKLGLSA